MVLKRSSYTLPMLAGLLFGQPAEWSVEASDYEHVMTVTAHILVDGSSSDLNTLSLAAFKDSECRGIADTSYLVGDKRLYFLLVYANSNQDLISFKVFNSRNGSVRTAFEQVTFSSGDAFGNPDQPFTIGVENITSLDTRPLHAGSLILENAFPNPFNARLNVEITRTDSESGRAAVLSLVDLSGRTTLQTAVNSGFSGLLQLNAEQLPSGIYLLQFNDGRHRQQRRVTLLK